MNFIPKTLTQLGIVEIGAAYADLEVTGIAIDSRKVSAGALFVARDGVNHRGIDYLVAAQEKGAVAAVIDSDNANLPLPETLTIPVFTVDELAKATGAWVNDMLGAPSEQLRVLAITGTNGKTSCAHFAAQMLSNLGVKTAVLGTVGNGFLGQLEVASHTTPDVISLHQCLAQYLEQGAEAVVMEASSHALDQFRVAGVQFDAVGFTNLSRDHLDYHGTMAEYGAAKARLFLDYDAPVKVINTDDEYGSMLLGDLSARGLVVKSVGEHSGADYRVENVNLDADGVSFSLQFGGQKIAITSAVIGRFNVANLSLVTTMLLGMGYTAEQVAAAATTVNAVPGRMELLSVPAKPTVLVDYAHTPDALEKALQASRFHCSANVWVVFGCGGDRDTGKRADMAKVAEALADHVIVTSDNPRSEVPQDIIDMILAGFSDLASVQYNVDRAAAIGMAIEQAGADDFILIAGKGHEDYQEIQGVKHHFSDQEVALALLKGGSAI